MKKTSHRFLAYALLALTIIIAICGYGLVIGGQLGFVFPAVEFVFVLAVLLFILSKKDDFEKPAYRFAEIILIAVIITALTWVTYDVLNDTRGVAVREFDTVVISANYRGSGNVTFETPEGYEGRASINDERTIVFDDESVFEEGDNIRIQEYNGLFDMPFYEIVGADEGKYYK